MTDGGAAQASGAGGADLFRLDGRVALVTGAAGYLGTAMATALAQAGAQVWLAGRDRDKLIRLSDSLASTGLQATPLPFDVTDAAARAAALDKMAEQTDRLDVLVNNAHISRSGSFTSAKPEDFAQAVSLSIAAAHALITGALPLLERAAIDGSPSVINVASMYGMVSPDPNNYTEEQMQNPPYYGAAKAGLLQLTRHAATHLGRRGVRVNAISPGPFPVASPPADPGLVDRLARRVPLGRIGKPEELRTTVLFLASPASTFITGINIPVDGGWTAW
jgi:NAD(P)-dependent dehydrogenase (short-subunit alcohol dehydrogenase family)